MCYHDDYCEVETDEIRAERDARARQARIAKRLRQRECLHANYEVTGYGTYLGKDGVFDYVSVWCRDCDFETELARSEWDARETV